MSKHTHYLPPGKGIDVDPRAIETIEEHNRMYRPRRVTILSTEEQADGTLVMTYDVDERQVIRDGRCVTREEAIAIGRTDPAMQVCSDEYAYCWLSVNDWCPLHGLARPGEDPCLAR